MMRRLAARRSDPLFSSTSSSSNNINAGSSNDNLHHLIIGNNNNSPSRRSPSNHNIKLSLSDDDATAKTPRHALCRNCRRITTLLSSLLSRCCSLYHRLKRMDPMYAATICIFLFVAIYTLVILSEIIFKFGPRGSIKGGLFGCILDQYIKDYTKYQTMSKWKDQVTNELHLPIVYKEQGGALIDKRWLPFGNSLSSRPNLAIVEMLLREKRRKVLLGKMIHDAVKDVKVCSSSNNNKQKKKKIFVANNNESDSSSSVLAGVVLQLQTKTSGQQPQQLLPYWLANIPALYNNGGVEAVTVDHSDIVPTDLLNDQLFQLHGQLLQLELNYSQERRRKGEQGRDDFSISSSIPQSIQNCAKFIANYNNNNNKDKYYYATRTDPTLHCLGYFLGGMQLGDDYQLLQQVRPHITNIFTIPSLYKHHATKSSSSASSPSCTSKVGYAVLSHTPTPEDQVRKSSSIWNHVSTIFSAFPPNHPAYLCLPPLHPNQVGISPYNTANEEISFQSTFVNQLVTAYESKRLDNLSSSSSSESIIWGVATLPCDFNDFSDVENAASCCNMVSVTMLDSITEGKSVEHYHLKNNAREDKLSHHLVFTFVTVPELDRSDNSRIIETPMQVSVSISERNPQQHKRTQASQYKESIQTKMRQKSWRCEPGWWCNRCLNAALYGSFSNCSFICGKCAPEFICNEREKGRQIDINVKVTGMNLSQKSVPAVNTMKWHHQRIPRIIHQTYFEDITKEKFPQLFRLQNTWKASGWEYRFYSDDTARNYIRTHYPERFVSVFDTLLPGAYKADFFRYLVLFREGGIYADIDVMLDANLDQFITPDLAFFAPIDSVGAYADENFCLWNGLIGSAPAHPALANAIEWMVNLVSSRGDLYDVERAVCEVTGVDKLENWKIRAEAGLILSGPCALGFAVNNALGKETLSKFVPGLMRSSPITSARGSVHRESDDVIGDVMILVADKTDLGSFRFSDPERNIFVASTDMPGLSKAPLVYEKQGGMMRNSKKKEKKLLPHYSVTNQGDALWGTHDVYADNLASPDRVKLQIHYE